MNLPPYGDQFRRTNAHLSSLKAMSSPEPDMFVNISPGGFWLTNKLWKEYVGGRSPGFTAPTQNAKWDLLCIHYNGNPMIIAGTPSTDPVLPPLERKAVPLAAIYLEAGDTKITSEKIFDLRLFQSTSFSHVDFEDRDHVDSHPITAITGLREELDEVESGSYWSSIINSKADVDGTTSQFFVLNKDFTGTPTTDAGIKVERGNSPDAVFKFNEQIGQWEYTNNGIDWVQFTNQGPAVQLQIASETVLGGVKVGLGLTVDPVTGVLNSDAQSTNDFSNTYKQKLDSIEPHATSDQLPSEIKTSYESNIDTNAFSDSEKIKLAGIEDGATAGIMSDGDVKVAYENNLNTNVFNDTEKNKLQTVEVGATGDMSPGEIKAAYESNADTNVFNDAEKVKLTGIEVAANAYVHPATHEPTVIAQNTNYRFVSDAEKTAWSSKADATNYWSKSELASTGGVGDRVDWSQVQNAPAFGSENWLDAVADITERDAISNPQEGNCVLVQDDGDGSAAQYTYNGSVWVKLADVDWSPMTDAQVKIAYENNSDTNEFTDAEKSKLLTVEANANSFVLDPASDSNLGGVMVGSGLNVDPTGLVSLDYTFDDSTHGVRGGGNLHQIASTEAGGFMSSADKSKLDGIEAAANSYVLPAATDSIRGGIKAGDHLWMSGDELRVEMASPSGDRGVVSVGDNIELDGEIARISVNTGSATVKGVVQVGDNINVSSGIISVSHASGSDLGLVKIGNNIQLDDLTGEISVDWATLPFDDTMHGTRIGGTLHALSTTSEHGFMSSTDKTKLNGVEAGATADMTEAEIKTAYESNTDTNVFTDTEKSKLTGIEDGATGNMTAGEIKAAYESNTDTNGFTDVLQTKLNGIEAAANAYVHPTTHPSTEIDQPVTTVVWVDGGRVDTYTEDGSINRPYKSLSSAVTNAPAGQVIFRVAPNTYAGDLTVTDDKHFISKGCTINGTIGFNAAGGKGSSFDGFIISDDGTNPTVQFYGGNSQTLTLHNCEVYSSGLLSALHMNNSYEGRSKLYANHTKFHNTGSGLAAQIQGNNTFEHRMCEFTADSNTRCIEYANTSKFAGHMSHFNNQVKVSDTAAGELHHPIISSGSQDCIQHDGGTLVLANPTNFGTGALISGTSTGTTVFANESLSVAYSPGTPGDWTGTPAIVSEALDELAGRPSGGVSWNYAATADSLPPSPVTGEMWFIGSLASRAGISIPVWYDGVDWVDGVGTFVDLGSGG